jgi:serine kinase of HPr protein (carbohydrate metabolism regulator)
MTVLVHATSVVIGRASLPFGGSVEAAVLLMGGSGAGKSDVALRLIAMGARLICDDQTALSVESGQLIAEAPSSLHGRMEIRGVGIVGIEAERRAPVILTVRLDEAAEVPRLPLALTHRLPQGLENCPEPPFLVLHALDASTPAKIAAAAAALSRGAFVAGLNSPNSGLSSEANAAILRPLPLPDRT